MGSPTPTRREARRRLPSLQLRLAAALSAVVALVVLASGYLAERGLRERETGRLEVSLARDARLVRELLPAPAIEAGQREALQALARRSAAVARARVTLIAGDGTVVADSEVPDDRLAAVENHAARPEVAAALAGRRGSATRLSRTVGRRFLYVGVPVGASGAGGSVRLAVDLETVEAAASELRGKLLTAGALGLLAAMLLSVALSGIVVRPVREISEVVGSIARGDLARRLPATGSGELERIARSVNEMADQLRGRLEELSEEKERLGAVLAGMVEGVLVVDVAGRVVLANPRLRELFGFGGDAEGRPHWEVVRRAEVEDAIRRAQEGDEAVVGDIATEAPVPERHLQLHAVRFPKKGEPLGVVAVFHDVTELRRLERMRRDFVANVSHELRTPLTAIRGFAETLQAGELDADTRSSFLGVIERHAERLAALIEDVLDLSRIESGKVESRPVEVDVGHVASLLVRDLHPRFADRDLQVDVDCAADAVAFADRRAVEQILQNLLDNATKYTEPGGRITVRAGAAGDRVRIEVEDSGIGIPPEDLPRIFERFYRVDKARSRDLGGTGLGLSIVKHQAQAQGGDVSVRSEPGSGSTFVVLLPRPRQ